jgi:hypothetical protein
VDVDPEGVFVLTSGRSGEEDPGLDDELGDELERPEALLDRVLVVGRRGKVGAVSDATQKAPENLLKGVEERNLNHVQIKVLINVLLCEQLIQYSYTNATVLVTLTPASTQNLLKTSWTFNSAVHV